MLTTLMNSISERLRKGINLSVAIRLGWPVVKINRIVKYKPAVYVVKADALQLSAPKTVTIEHDSDRDYRMDHIAYRMSQHYGINVVAADTETPKL